MIEIEIQAVDIWAAGLVLYSLCFNKHPFDDSNKLAIVNGNYKIPAADSRYRMFHPLINNMLALDPRTRPTAGQVLGNIFVYIMLCYDMCNTQVLDQLSAISETHGFSLRGGLAGVSSVVAPAAPSPLVTPSLELPPRLPDGPTLVSPDTAQPAASNVAMFKASAGSLFSKLKDTTKSVVNTVQSSMVGRELDFHCVTSRVAAMSMPAEGIESTYRNHIDDVRAMMESKHAGHYAVYNTSERASNPSKYPSGQLVEAGWAAGTVPSLDTALDLCAAMLDYLSRDLRNVVVVYCGDGKSNTAYIVTSLLLYCGLVTTAEAGLAIFSAKRCEPVLTASQLEALRHLATLVRDKPPVLKSPFVTITNIVIEPIPLFNKAGDGCRPYVEVYQGKERVISTVQEYSRMKGYSVTSGDDAAVLPVNVTVCGDVMIIVNHARQVLGSTKPVKICQVQFHSSSLTAGRPSYEWRLAALDCVTEPARFSEEFKLVMNSDTSEECSGRQLDWPDTSAAQLLCNSDQDFDFVRSLIPATSTNTATAPSRPPRGGKFYVNNPDLDTSPKSPVTPDTRSASSDESPSSVDLLGLSSGPPKQETSASKEESLISGLADLGVAPRSNDKPSASAGVNLLDPTPPASASNTFDFLAGLGSAGSGPCPAPPAQPPASHTPASNNLSDLFGRADISLATPVLNATSMPRGTSQPDIKKTEESFDPFGSLGGSLSSQNLAGQQQSRQSPLNSQQQQPVNPNRSNTSIPSTAKPSNPTQMGPNYSRSFFTDNTNNSMGMGGSGVKPKVSSNAFDDLLGGFAPTSNNANQNQSIGAMKKVELVKAMDPDEARIFEWKEGKSRNIRTLLCSLHKIIWAGARWTECGMHQLVSTADVKKMYRKACLAVHPDKQMGTENENISKLIFMELNEAWSEFENDPNQQNMFG